MFKLRTLGILCLMICAFAGNSLAWSDTGHKITGYIAWTRMTPATREVVVKILRDAPEDSHLSVFFTPYGSQTQDVRERDLFMVTATWADLIRERSFETRYKKYHHSNWHYSDTFWTRGANGIEILKAPEEGGLGLERLREFDALIRSSASNSAKAIAIAWLVHIIGDIHQPLHTSARVTELEPKGDQGGNLFLLTPQGTPRNEQENLHWFWDSIIERNIPNRDNECDADFIIPIAEKLMRSHPYEKMRGRLAPGDFTAWMTESLKLAQVEVFSPDLVRFQKPGEKYKKKAFNLSRERLTMAGYRMADLFNTVFGASKAP
jgi:hypothetical protein